jgi:predicted dienelactone hydrolase
MSAKSPHSFQISSTAIDANLSIDNFSLPRTSFQTSHTVKLEASAVDASQLKAIECSKVLSKAIGLSEKRLGKVQPDTAQIYTHICEDQQKSSEERVSKTSANPKFSSKSRRRWHRFGLRSVLGTLAVALGIGMALPATAAERVVIRLGPIRQSIAIRDLEYFVQTGEVPSKLRLYSPLLTQDVRQVLSTHIRLDQNVGDKLVEDLLHSSGGERFLNTLQVAIPDTEVSQLKTALSEAALQPDGISLLGFLRSLPDETVTIDAIAAIGLASQMNLPFWQSQTLSSVLARELTVEAKPISADLDPTQSGPYWVWKDTLTLRDYQRDRIIPIDIYRSRRKTKGPLVVLSHGFGADRRFLGYLAYHLASYGLTVVAIEHPGSNVAWLTGESGITQAGLKKASSILPATEFVDRPKDVSFLLNRLNLLNRYSGTLRGKFNTDEVVVVGHSLGGYTALALAGTQLSLEHLQQFCSDPNPVMLSPADLLQCNAADLPEVPTDLGDERVRQVVLLNPVIGRLFDEKSLAEVEIPTLMLASTDDSITPAVSQQFLPFTQLHNSKYLLTAIGATHLSVGDPANLNRALTQSFFVRERQEETEALRQLLRGVTLAFIQQQTPEAEQFKPFLTPAYAQSFSSNGVKLRLNSELPPNFANWLKMAALPMEQLVASTLSTRRDPYAASLCQSDLGCLLNSLPIVMFILPGSLPIAGKTLLELKRKQRRRS